MQITKNTQRSAAKTAKFSQEVITYEIERKRNSSQKMQEKEERKVVANQDRKAVQLKRAEREQLTLAQSQPIVSFFKNG